MITNGALLIKGIFIFFILLFILHFSVFPETLSFFAIAICLLALVVLVISVPVFIYLFFTLEKLFYVNKPMSSSYWDYPKSDSSIDNSDVNIPFWNSPINKKDAFRNNTSSVSTSLSDNANSTKEDKENNLREPKTRSRYQQQQQQMSMSSSNNTPPNDPPPNNEPPIYPNKNRQQQERWWTDYEAKKRKQQEEEAEEKKRKDLQEQEDRRKKKEEEERMQREEKERMRREEEEEESKRRRQMERKEEAIRQKGYQISYKESDVHFQESQIRNLSFNDTRDVDYELSQLRRLEQDLDNLKEELRILNNRSLDSFY